MTESQKHELTTWTDWNKTQDPNKLNELLTSLNPFLQSQVNKFGGAPIPRSAIESHAKVLAIQAFKTYDPTKAALNTHVGNNLRHLSRYVIEYQNVGKIPEHRGLQISRFHNTMSRMKDDLGREPNVTELADELGWSSAEVERMKNELRSDLTVTQGKEEAFFDYGNNQSDKTKDIIEFVYYSASPEDKLIIEYWFGIGGSPKLTVAEMAQRLGRSESYVRNRSKDIAKQINDSLSL